VSALPDSGRAPRKERALLRGVRMVAALEAIKGALVLFGGLGLFALLHGDVQAGADHLVRRFHLNPARHYPHIFLDAMQRVTDARLWWLAAGAAAYACARFIEAYGLWRGRSWAEWFAVVAGGIYIPIEVYELFRSVTWPKVSLFVTNVAIVAYLAYVLRAKRRIMANREGGS
jgi:uncharacterized membrane protein (DUF2068 family)